MAKFENLFEKTLCRPKGKHKKKYPSTPCFILGFLPRRTARRPISKIEITLCGLKRKHKRRPVPPTGHTEEAANQHQHESLDLYSSTAWGMAHGPPRSVSVSVAATTPATRSARLARPRSRAPQHLKPPRPRAPRCPPCPSFSFHPARKERPVRTATAPHRPHTCPDCVPGWWG